MMKEAYWFSVSLYHHNSMNGKKKDEARIDSKLISRSERCKVYERT